MSSDLCLNTAMIVICTYCHNAFGKQRSREGWILSILDDRHTKINCMVVWKVSYTFANNYITDIACYIVYLNSPTFSLSKNVASGECQFNQWMCLYQDCLALTVDCVGFANSCSAFYKPQAMNNNDCAIQSLTRACKRSVVIIFMFCGLGSRGLLFLQTQRNPQ